MRWVCFQITWIYLINTPSFCAHCPFLVWFQLLCFLITEPSSDFISTPVLLHPLHLRKAVPMGCCISGLDFSRCPRLVAVPAGNSALSCMLTHDMAEAARPWNLQESPGLLQDQHIRDTQLACSVGSYRGPLLPFAPVPSWAGWLKSKHFLREWQKLRAVEFLQFLSCSWSCCDLATAAAQENKILCRVWCVLVRAKTYANRFLGAVKQCVGLETSSKADLERDIALFQSLNINLHYLKILNA